MSYVIKFAETATDAPEYRSTCPVDCARCGREMDLDEDILARTHDDTGYVCEDCYLRCFECDNWLENDCKSAVVSDALFFDHHPYCQYCFATMLCAEDLL